MTVSSTKTAALDQKATGSVALTTAASSKRSRGANTSVTSTARIPARNWR